MANVNVLKQSELRKGDGEVPHKLVLVHLPGNEYTPFCVYWQTFRDAKGDDLGEPAYMQGVYKQTIEEGLLAFSARNPDKSEVIA